MSVITLSNSQISVAIKTLGAELCSIKNKLNREFMWEGNPNFWGKHSPVLFPIVGTLKNNTFYHNDTKYTLTRHGFARDMEFELIEKTEDSATFSIQSNSATLLNYPFEFELQIQYTLINTTVEIDYKVVNKDNSEIPFSIGAHPAFALPSSFEDYNLDFEKVEPLEYTLLENDLVSQQTEKILTDSNKVPLTYELFKRDALIFKKLQSNSLTIIEEEKPISIEVDGKSKMKPIESYEVKILSIGFFTSPSQAVIWRGPMAAKALNQMIFDADWGELDFMLIDLPPGTGDIHLSIMQSLPITGAVVVSTPQAVALADAKKGVAMFLSEAINVPVLGIIENMAYFTPEELPNNKYYIFGQEGAKNLAADLNVPFLGEVPIVQSIREAGDYGRPAAMQEGSVIETIFQEITRNVVQETVNRNDSLPATEAIKITTMAGCSAVKK